MEMARCRLVGQLHEWVNTVAALPRIQSSRYQVSRMMSWLLGVGGGGVLSEGYTINEAFYLNLIQEFDDHYHIVPGKSSAY